MGIKKKLRDEYGSGFLSKALQDICLKNLESEYIGSQYVKEDQEPGVIQRAWNYISNAIYNLFSRVASSISNMSWVLLVKKAFIPDFIDQLILLLEKSAVSTGEFLADINMKLNKYIKQFWEFVSNVLFGGNPTESQKDAMEETSTFEWISQKSAKVFKDVAHLLADNLLIVVRAVRDLLYKALEMTSAAVFSILDAGYDVFTSLRDKSLEFSLFFMTFLSNPKILLGKTQAYINNRMQALGRRFAQFAQDIKRIVVGENLQVNIVDSYLYKTMYGTSSTTLQWILDSIDWVVSTIKRVLSSVIPWFKNLIFMIPVFLSILAPYFAEFQKQKTKFNDMTTQTRVLDIMNKVFVKSDRINDLVTTTWDTMEFFTNQQKSQESDKWNKKDDEIFSEEDIATRLMFQVYSQKEEIDEAKFEQDFFAYVKGRTGIEFEDIVSTMGSLDHYQKIELARIHGNLFPEPLGMITPIPSQEELEKRKEEYEKEKKVREELRKFEMQKVLDEQKEVRKQYEIEVEKKKLELEKRLAREELEYSIDDLRLQYENLEKEFKRKATQVSELDQKMKFIQTPQFQAIVDRADKVLLLRGGVELQEEVKDLSMTSLSDVLATAEMYDSERNNMIMKFSLTTELTVINNKLNTIGQKLREREENIRLGKSRWNFLKIKMVGMIVISSLLFGGIIFATTYFYGNRTLPNAEPKSCGNWWYACDESDNGFFSWISSNVGALINMPVLPNQILEESRKLFSEVSVLNPAFTVRLAAIFTSIVGTAILGASTLAYTLFVLFILWFFLLDILSGKFNNVTDAVKFYSRLFVSRTISFVIVIVKTLTEFWLTPLQQTPDKIFSAGEAVYSGLGMILSAGSLGGGLWNLFSKAKSIDRVQNTFSTDFLKEEFFKAYIPSRTSLMPVEGIYDIDSYQFTLTSERLKQYEKPVKDTDLQIAEQKTTKAIEYLQAAKVGENFQIVSSVPRITPVTEEEAEDQ